MVNELGGLAALPGVPARHAVGPSRAGEGGPLVIHVEAARPGAKRLDVEIKVAALDLALQARRPAEGISALHFRTFPVQLHQAQVSQPEAGKVGRLAAARGRVWPPAVPEASIPARGFERSLEGV